jgi:hypothetical protein
MTKLDHALRLAEHGFLVFPVVPGGKTPLIDGWQAKATRDPATIRSYWVDNIMEVVQPWNVGILTTGYLVVDVDNSPGKDGELGIFKLELEGKYLPETFEQRTPTGGRHLIYRTTAAVGNSGGRLADDVDVRGRGGLVVGAGSEVGGGEYTANWAEVATAPDWLVEACLSEPVAALSLGSETPVDVDPGYAERRAVHFLQRDATIAIEGQAGNHTTYTVAAVLKDMGVDALTAHELMLDHWNDRCEPPWAPDELAKVVENAYRYGRAEAGSAAPETEFTDLPVPEEALAVVDDKANPIREFNKRHAFVIAGNGHHILWETKDAKGDFELKHINEQSFHRMYAGRSMSIGNGKTDAISKLWMASDERRSYDGFCFSPGRPTPKGFYNLFHGFAVEPSEGGSPEAQAAVKRFLEHALENVCRGEKGLFDWLIGYFAHLVQRPWEKPLVALVFRGEKGVGKNALIDRIGYLLGIHALVASDSRYLIGNFNSHLERCLLLTLDEAFWSGDKKAEGALKNLITGNHHVIERKGHEAYKVDNCTRVAILGNEEWLVPATQDERRFAVFDVGTGRKQDREYFHDMRVGMERGGYSLLLRFLLDFDLSKIDVNGAPRTQGLLEQKLKSLQPFHRWWFDCLDQGEILGAEFAGPWPDTTPKEGLREAFRRYLRDNVIRVRVPEDRAFGRYLRDCLPSVRSDGKTIEDGRKVNTYQLPPLSQAREEFEGFIGHPVDWGKS